jgi:starch-binding outer membrane protein SusE/F
MKNILKILFSSMFLAVTFFSCKKDEIKIFYEGGTAPVLKASSTSPMVLNVANRNNTALTLNWTNPGYRFTTGVSSQDVTYILQMDTTGSNFTNPKKYEKSISKELSISLTVAELNTALLSMDMVENMPHNMEIRIKSSLGNGSVPLLSNVLKIVITPYLDVVYPVPAKLFITGGATPAGWMGGGDPELASQQFTKISTSEFELASIALKANEGFLFVPVYGNWSNKYGFIGANLTNNVNGDEFKPEGGDLKSPALAGNYRINVSFKTGKYTLTKL